MFVCTFSFSLDNLFFIFLHISYNCWKKRMMENRTCWRDFSYLESFSGEHRQRIILWYFFLKFFKMDEDYSFDWTVGRGKTKISNFQDFFLIFMRLWVCFSFVILTSSSPIQLHRTPQRNPLPSQNPLQKTKIHPKLRHLLQRNKRPPPHNGRPPHLSPIIRHGFWYQQRKSTKYHE